METVINYFAQPQNGILGIIVIVLGFVIVWEEKQKSDLRKEIKTLSTDLATLAEKRVNDLERIKDADFALLEKIRIAESEKSDRLREMVGSVLSIAQNLQNLFNLKGK